MTTIAARLVKERNFIPNWMDEDKFRQLLLLAPTDVLLLTPWGQYFR